MTGNRPVLIGLAAIPLVALAIAGCGGSNDNPGTASAPKTGGGGSATIGEADVGGLGKILVDSSGRTVYLFEKDTGSQSTCSGGCAVQWPPVTTKGKPTVGSGLTASKVGTTARADGTKQVTYDGHPLYLFKGDSGSGDASGQGVNAFGALWYVLSPAGNAVTASASSSAGGSGY
jgi:predicted lipoprotein with Yx(FWY)xxD motif